MNATNARLKWWLMAFSIVLGVLSAWAINRHLQEKSEEIESRSRLELITLLVAARDLSPNSILDENDIATEQFPSKWASDDAFTPESVDLVVGKRLMTEVRAGQPLIHLHLLEAEGPSVSSRLAPNFKAVSIAVEAGGADLGHIRKGDHVDLYVSFEHHGKRITAALLHSVEVLSAGLLAQPSARSESLQSSHSAVDSNITVAISQTDAVKLIAARESGSIRAVLSSTDQQPTIESISLPSGDLAALLGLEVHTAKRDIPILYGDRLSIDQDSAQEGGLTEDFGRSRDTHKYSAAYK